MWNVVISGLRFGLFDDVTTPNVRDSESNGAQLRQSTGAAGVAMAETKVLRVRRDNRRIMSESALNLTNCSQFAASVWSHWLQRHWPRHRKNPRFGKRKVKRGCVRYGTKWIPLRTFVCVQVFKTRFLL